MPEKQRPIVHLFCNAHIDPVWRWGWEEGAREAISTFRTAVNLLDEFPEFVFNHNESLLYEWVEEYDPPLFERIREHVRQGRWNITGGWYLQPDCNLLGGETLVRLIMEGRRYFQDKFGVCPPVSYNFDTFGHPGSLPQLLKQSGFEMYIHCRPDPTQLDLPGLVYRWQGIDGTQIVTVRPHGWYCNVSEGCGQANAREAAKLARQIGEDVLITWGLGNHGGGATREDLNLFRQVIAEYADTDVEIRHSTPEAYLARIRASIGKYPIHHGELQRVLAGCYTSVAPIKREMREGEALLASAERWAAIAWWRYGYPYPADELRQAWKRQMFNTFHDVLCGSLLEEALPAVHDMYGYAQDVARRIVVKSQHALLQDVPPKEGTIPIYVFNPNASRVQAPVGLNYMADYRHYASHGKNFALYDDHGAQIPAQKRGGRSVFLEEGAWNPYLTFVADVPPLAVRRYELRPEAPVPQEAAILKVAENKSNIIVESQFWTARFSRQKAALVELVERSSGRNVLRAPVQLFAMHDVAHAWGGMNNAVYNVPVSPLKALSPAQVGDFTGMEGRQGPALRVLANGPVSVIVECLVGWQHTRASLKFVFYADLPYVDVDTRLYMQARRKMIKLLFPFDLARPRVVCEVPYGTAERPADATEYPYARWVRLETSGFTVGLANSGQNGLDVSPEGTLGLSISRGAVHCHWDEPPEGLDLAKSWTFMDQTQIDTRFRLLGGSDGETVAAQLVPAALDLNQPLERFFTYFPPSVPDGAPTAPMPFVQIEPATVILGALKKADQEDALIIRLVESLGRKTSAQVTVEGKHTRRIDFDPYEIKTFKLKRDRQQVAWQETSLLEE
jgi:alpha-mannosidase